MQRLSLGLYEADLNIPLGLPVEYSQTQKMVGFNDRLYAKAVSLRYRDTKVLVVSVDVIALTRDICDEIRDDVQRKYGVPKGNVAILATHTHSSPDTLFWPLNYYTFSQDIQKDFGEFKQLLKQNILHALTQAMKREDEVLSIFHSSTECHGLFTNRDEPTRTIDSSVASLLLKCSGKSVIFVNHNAHPTVIGSSNRGYSADFPGYLSRRVIERLGVDQVNCITGSSADVSVRQTLGDNDSPLRSLESARRYGNIMGDLVVSSLSQCKQINDFELGASSEPVSFDIKRHPDRDGAIAIKASLEEQLKRTQSAVDRTRIIPAIRGIDMWLRVLDLNGELPKTLQGDIGAVRLGQDKFALVWAPGEIFSYTGLKVKKQSKFDLTMISGYGNGYSGYFPNSEAYKNLEYEANVTPVEESAHQVLETSILKLVGR